jgi:glyoxylase-like metal-dependent hydrolase (beta-lactamase superfamily II)
LFSGDHVLGRGTSVIVWPDGDMRAYVEGVRRLIDLNPSRIFPGHGPVIDEPAPVLAYYLSHRLEREQQVLGALAAGPATPPELTLRVYADVDVSLHRIAEMSLRAHLAKLAAEGRAANDGETWTLV